MRADVLKTRQTQKLPWHSPPHIQGDNSEFHITAACYEHHPIIGFSIERIRKLEETITQSFKLATEEIYAWSILPNYYHLLIKTTDLKSSLKKLHQIHGSSSYYWNKEENSRGRRVWFNALEHAIKSERHFWATINYIHNNPVKHEYVKKWQDWPFSSFKSFLMDKGREETIRIWKEYDISDMGKDWDN